MMWMTKKDKMEKEAFENQIFGNLATSYREAVKPRVAKRFWLQFKGYASREEALRNIEIDRVKYSNKTAWKDVIALLGSYDKTSLDAQKYVAKFINKSMKQLTER